MAIYESLTKYLLCIENNNVGEWIFDRESKGTLEDPIQFPHVSYSNMVRGFIKDVYDFASKHPEHELTSYNDILVANNIKCGEQPMNEEDVAAVDGKCIMALLMGIIRFERFCDGALLSFFKSGNATLCLSRLKELDNNTGISPSQ